MDKPIIYLLCGLPGSGKTTYADQLTEREDVIKLSIDDEMLNRFGVAGQNYDIEKHKEYKTNVIKDLNRRIIKLISTGNSLVLDFGVWKKQDRLHFRKLIEDNGGECRLLYFKASKSLLLRRLELRNLQENNTKNRVDEERLNVVLESFEVPLGENEVVIEQIS